MYPVYGAFDQGPGLGRSPTSRYRSTIPANVGTHAAKSGCPNLSNTSRMMQFTAAVRVALCLRDLHYDGQCI